MFLDLSLEWLYFYLQRTCLLAELQKKNKKTLDHISKILIKADE